MINILIDSSDLVRQFPKLEQRDIDQLKSFTVKRITANFYERWMSEAGRSLRGTRNIYQKSLVVVDSGKFSGSIMLTNFLPNAVEEGLSAFDMKCIVNPRTSIYTSKGYKFIKNIEVGDLVLTHNGKMQRVVKIWKEKNEDEYVYKINVKIRNSKRSEYSNLIVTGNHPLLTNNGWKMAKDLDYKIDKLKVTAKKCNNCGELITTTNIDKIIYCNKSCAANKNNIFRAEKGRVDLTEIGRNNIRTKVIETNKRMHSEGKHASLPGGNLYVKMKNNHQWGVGSLNKDEMRLMQKKAAVAIGARHNFSDPESILWGQISDISGITRQHCFERDEYYFHPIKKNQRRKYFFDFAIPSHKICIEVNGEKWHTAEQNELKKKEVESKGWRYISFWSKEIYKNLQGCVDEIHRVLNNHEENYYFSESEFTIEKIKTKRTSLSTTYNFKYNLTVDNDSSYVANGIVTHNSGFFASSKVKYTKDGRPYMTIPFRMGTPGAVGESEVFTESMPVQIYDLVKNRQTNIPNSYGKRSNGISLSDLKNVPEYLSAPRFRAEVSNGTQKWEEYVNKTSVYEGLSKMKDNVTGQNRYGSFRRVSAQGTNLTTGKKVGSDPNIFIHTGIQAHKLMEKALGKFDIEKEAAIAQDVWLANYLGM